MEQAVGHGQAGSAAAPALDAMTARDRGRSRDARPRQRPAPARGWTLLELMIVVTLGALLVALGVPGYHDWIANYELASRAEQLAGSLTLARAEAIKRGLRVNLCRTAEGRHCGDGIGWEAGWLVYVDVNGDGRDAGDEPVLRREGAAPKGIHVQGNRPVDEFVSFNGLGQARLPDGGLQMGTFTICRRGFPARKVVLANSGRVRVEKSRDVCTD